MKDFSSYIGIIGGGIAGLTAGCILKSHGINTIIFERASQISEYGAGISISANGLKIFDAMGLTNSLTNSSFTPSETNFQYLDSILKRLNIESLVTSSRKEVLHVLFSEYSRLGGEILYAHEHVNIDINSCEITFSNNAKYKVSHILACDGIRSKVRDMYFPASGKPLYSGYSAWRGIGISESKTIQFHFGPGAHIVTYPINKTGRSSFVGIIKNKEVYEDSWKVKGSKEAMLNDFQSFNTDIFNMIDSSEDIYKWGIFIRPPLKSIYVKNITLIGDAAHPMVHNVHAEIHSAQWMAFSIHSAAHSTHPVVLSVVYRVHSVASLIHWVVHLVSPCCISCRVLFVSFLWLFFHVSGALFILLLFP